MIYIKSFYKKKTFVCKQPKSRFVENKIIFSFDHIPFNLKIDRNTKATKDSWDLIKTIFHDWYNFGTFERFIVKTF